MLERSVRYGSGKFTAHNGSTPLPPSSPRTSLNGRKGDEPESRFLRSGTILEEYRESRFLAHAHLLLANLIALPSSGALILVCFFIFYKVDTTCSTELCYVGGPAFVVGFVTFFAAVVSLVVWVKMPKKLQFDTWMPNRRESRRPSYQYSMDSDDDNAPAAVKINILSDNDSDDDAAKMPLLGSSNPAIPSCYERVKRDLTKDDVRGVTCCDVVVLQLLYVINCIAIIMLAFAAFSLSLLWENKDKFVDPHMVKRYHIGLGGAVGICIFSQMYCLYGNITCSWSSSKNLAKGALLTINIFLMVLAATIVISNQRALEYLSRDGAHPDVAKWAFHGTEATGVIIGFVALVGLFITLITFSNMEDVYLSSTSLPLPYLVLFSGTMPLVVTFIGIEIWQCTYEVKHGEAYAKIYRVTAAANVVMLFLTFSMLYATRIAYSTLINPTLPSGLEAEEVDISEVPDDVLDKWAARIDEAQGVGHIGAWDGRAAFDMMKLYSKKTIKHTEGICLKLTRKSVKSARPVRTPLARMWSKDGKSRTSKLGAKGGSDKDIVAFVFIFLMKRFDLASRLKNALGRALSYMFGSDSCVPLLTMRWGLVGFQWPFHSGVFLADVSAVEHYRQSGGRMGESSRPSSRGPSVDFDEGLGGGWSAPRPVDIMTRIMRCIIEWNDSRGPRGATVLMLPRCPRSSNRAASRMQGTWASRSGRRAWSTYEDLLAKSLTTFSRTPSKRMSAARTSKT